MGSSNPFKAIVKAVSKVVKVIVEVVKFVVKAIVNFVKGVFKGDIGSIVMLIAIVFTFGAALGFWMAGLGITLTTAVVSTAFSILGSEFQRQKAEKMKKAAEADLQEQAAREEDRLTAELRASNEDHFQKMEDGRYQGYESGEFGIGSFEPDGTFIGNGEGATPETEDKSDSSITSTLGLITLSLLGGYLVSASLGE